MGGKVIDQLLGSPFGRAGTASAVTERAKNSQSGTTMNLPKDNSKLDMAKKLRREMTPHERKLWYLFLKNYPVKIYKQRIIDRFIVDFYCASAKLVIEIDGSQHYEDKGQISDQERTAILESYGLKVIRYSNREIDREFSAVCESIIEAINERSS